MKVKIIDASWIADKAMDGYAEMIISSESVNVASRIRNPTSFVRASVKKLFEKIYHDAISSYSIGYDKILIVVSCFPIMRLNKPTILTRYVCKNSGYLHSHGISSSQFLELFEKFIQVKCKNGDVTQYNNCVWLKSKTASFDDWKTAILDNFGSTMCDFSKDSIFENNPNFILNVDLKSSGSRDIDALEKFKLDKNVKNLL